MSQRPVPSDPPVETAAIRRLYRRPPSFTDLLPWVEYLPESRSFLLEDGVSVGALFELTPVGTEARTPRFLAELRDAIQTALTDAIPERDDSPWILQVYVQDTPSLKAFQREVADYARPEAADSAFTRHFQQTLAEHLEQVSRPGRALHRRGGDRHPLARADPKGAGRAVPTHQGAGPGAPGGRGRGGPQ